MYELIKRLQDFAAGTMRDEDAKLAFDASDAIQELMNDLEQSRHYEEFWQHEAEEALGKYQVAIAKKPQWIPVTERLPEHLTSVIIHRKDGGIFIWEYFDTSPTDECWIDDSMNVYSFYDVTHWMPLPEPPEEE